MEEPPRQHAGPALGTVVGGRYRLVRDLGSGRLGAVYEAVDLEDGDWVAVEVMFRVARGDADRRLVERFLGDAAVTMSLDHAHLVRARDRGWDEEIGSPFIVLPLMEGEDLGALLARVGPLHPTLVARIGVQACRGLEAAHQAGVVHRDIRPENLFLDHDEQGLVTVRLLDFGVATCVAAEETFTGERAVLGTPHYVSPEQAQSANEAAATMDVWSLGATLYHALAGAPPFAGASSLAELSRAIESDGAPPLTLAAPWLDAGLATIVHGALIRDPRRRCPSARALGAALGPFTGGSEAIAAHMLDRLPEQVRQGQAQAVTPPSVWTVVAPAAPPPALTLDADPFVGKRVGDGYSLVRRLGRGGMGTVYEAEGAQRRRYALKLIDPELAGTSPAALRRFAREALAVASLDHPHVVRVIDAGTTGEIPFIVMELLHGVDLRAVIDARSPLVPEVAVRLIVQACRGIAEAHRCGVIHRDVKPANLFLHQLPSGAIELKVCDFGVAKRTELKDAASASTELTRTGGVLGSPRYMSPEQASDAKSADHRSDIWSLGITLYEALAGQSPWQEHDTVGRLIVAICTAEVPPLAGRAPWLEPGLASAVHRALCRDPAQRFQSMDELERALAPFTGGSELVTMDDLARLAETARARAFSGRPSVRRGSQRRLRALAVGAAAAALAGYVVLSPRPPGQSASDPAAGDIEADPAALAGRGSLPEPSDLADVASGRDASAEPSRSAFVLVDPPEALATLDGVSTPLVDGVLRLDGAVGQSFAVEVRHGGRVWTGPVRIDETGEAVPPRIWLPAPAHTQHSQPRPPDRSDRNTAPPQPATAEETAATTATPPSPGTPQVSSASAGPIRPFDSW